MYKVCFISGFTLDQCHFAMKLIIPQSKPFKVFLGVKFFKPFDLCFSTRQAIYSFVGFEENLWVGSLLGNNLKSKHFHVFIPQIIKTK